MACASNSFPVPVSPVTSTAAVVGATYPRDLADIRMIIPDAPLLIPGVGKQGGDVVAAVKAAAKGNGPFVINSSSGIIFAADPRAAAITLRDQINAALAA